MFFLGLSSCTHSSHSLSLSLVPSSCFFLSGPGQMGRLLFFFLSSAAACPCGWQRFSSVSILQVKWRHAWRSFPFPNRSHSTPLHSSLSRSHSFCRCLSRGKSPHVSTTFQHSHLHVRSHTHTETLPHTRTHSSKPTACMFLMGGTKGYLMLTKI